MFFFLKNFTLKRTSRLTDNNEADFVCWWNLWMMGSPRASWKGWISQDSWRALWSRWHFPWPREWILQLVIDHSIFLFTKMYHFKLNAFLVAILLFYTVNVWLNQLSTVCNEKGLTKDYIAHQDNLAATGKFNVRRTQWKNLRAKGCC